METNFGFKINGSVQSTFLDSTSSNFLSLYDKLLRLSSESPLNAIPKIATVLFAKPAGRSCETIKFGNPSLISMAAWPRKKLLLENADNCRVSFNRHGPAANPARAKLRIRGYSWVTAS